MPLLFRRGGICPAAGMDQDIARIIELEQRGKASDAARLGLRTSGLLYASRNGPMSRCRCRCRPTHIPRRSRPGLRRSLTARRPGRVGRDLAPLRAGRLAGAVQARCRGLPGRRARLRRQPRSFRIRAATHSARIAIESAESRFDASIVRCVVLPESWAVSTSFSRVTEVGSASPARTTTAPDCPASTDISSTVTGHRHRLCLTDH